MALSKKKRLYKVISRASRENESSSSSFFLSRESKRGDVLKVFFLPAFACIIDTRDFISCGGTHIFQETSRHRLLLGFSSMAHCRRVRRRCSIRREITGRSPPSSHSHSWWHFLTRHLWPCCCWNTDARPALAVKSTQMESSIVDRKQRNIKNLIRCLYLVKI